MPNSDNNTRGIVRHAQISCAATGTFQVGGDITMPAGGPWSVTHIYSAAVLPLNAASASISYHVQLESRSNDTDPPISASNFPGMAWNASDLAGYNNQAMPLQLYPMQLSIAGKGTLRMNIINESAIAISPHFMLGIIFGSTPAPIPSLKQCHLISAAISTTLEQQYGTFTMSEAYSKITGIYSYPIINASAIGSGPLIYSLRLTSDDKKIQPCEFPGHFFAPRCQIGAIILGHSGQLPFLPLDIPMTPGSRIDLFGTCPTSISGSITINTFLSIA